MRSRLQQLRRRLHSLRSERGQAVTEFALIAPLFIFLLLALLQFALILNAQIVVADAAREGAREMAIQQPRGGSWQSTVAQAVLTDLQGGGLSATTAEYSPQFPYASGDLVEQDTQGDLATVTVTYRYPNFVPLLPLLLGQPAWSSQFTLHSTTSFMLEQ